MKKPVAGADLMPKMMGTEHELSVLFTPRLNVKLPFEYGATEDDVVDQAEALDYLVWQDDMLSKFLLENGSFWYRFDEHPSELATPECATPDELLRYSLAGREIVRACAERTLANFSYSTRSVSLNERVIDSTGTTWGEHDNFSLELNEHGLKDHRVPLLLLLHTLTRGVVSGAGHVDSHKGHAFSFSQKLKTATAVTGKTWGSTMFYYKNEALEVRCSDKNVSEWAHLMRLGSTALVLGMVRAGINAESIGQNTYGFTVAELKEHIYRINEFDFPSTDRNGEVFLNYPAIRALAIQRALAETACFFVDCHDDIDPIYRKIASEWLRFCERLSAVDTDRPINMTDFLEADWAAKFYHIQRGIVRDRDEGFLRTPYDDRAKATDIRYGQYLLDCPVPGEKIFVVAGAGFKLNDRHPKRRQITKDLVKGAIWTPPAGRAESRVRRTRDALERDRQVNSVDWEGLQYDELNRYTSEIETTTIRF